MEPILYDYECVPTIEAFTRCKAFKKALIGPFGSGKSSGCVINLVELGQDQAPSTRDGVRRIRVAAVRNSYPQLRDTTIKTVHDWLPPKLFGTWRSTDHDYVINKLTAPDGTPVEITIMFRALDKPEHVSNLLSMELTYAWFNEAREIPKVIVDAMEGRVGRFPSRKEGGCSHFGLLFDTNPPDTDHWFYKMFEEDKQPNTEIFHQPSGLSPDAENLINLPPFDGSNTYYTNLMQGKDDNFIKVYIHGEYGYSSDGKPVYVNYKDSLHCAKEELKPIPGLPLILGFDFGLTPACAIGQLSPKGQLRILDEVIADDMGIRRFAREKLKPYMFTNYRRFELVGAGDPAGVKRADTDERTCYMELKDAGFPMVPAHSNAPLTRINAVDNYLTKLYMGEPGFVLSPKCKVLRKGFIDGYRRRRMQISGMEVYTDEPEKNEYSHPHDALQYLCLYIDRFSIKQTRTAMAKAKALNYPKMTKAVAALAYT